MMTSMRCPPGDTNVEEDVDIPGNSLLSYRSYIGSNTIRVYHLKACYKERYASFQLSSIRQRMAELHEAKAPMLRKQWTLRQLFSAFRESVDRNNYVQCFC